MGVVLAQRAGTLLHALAMCFLLCSDGTLNPNGVRFGSSEIYNIGSCMSPAVLPRVQGGPQRAGEGGHPCSGVRVGPPCIHFLFWPYCGTS